MGTIRTHKTTLQTATASTGSATIEGVVGKIISVAISVSASTNFTISFPLGGVNQNILGVVGATALTVATSAIFYPVETRCLVDGTDSTADANLFSQIAVDQQVVTVAASALTADDTWSVTIITEE